MNIYLKTLLMELPILIILMLFNFYNVLYSDVLYYIYYILNAPGLLTYGFIISIFLREIPNPGLFISNAIIYYFVILLILKWFADKKKSIREGIAESEKSC
jgi:hypothetical protein